MPPVLKYGNKVKAPCILYLFPSWGYVFSNHWQYFLEGWAPLCPSHISHATSEAATAVAIPKATRHKYQCQAAQPNRPKHRGINPLLRSPAQAHVLKFQCLPLSQLHSQIP